MLLHLPTCRDARLTQPALKWGSLAKAGLRWTLKRGLIEPSLAEAVHGSAPLCVS